MPANKEQQQRDDTSSALERAAWSPQIETFRRGDKLVVRADLPGLKKEDVNVEVDNGMLAISGERREQHEEDRDGFYRSERSYGQFYRALPIPEGVSDAQCEATFKDGVLEVTLPAPKEEQRTAKQIPIR
jgi:HSP20 family protein